MLFTIAIPLIEHLLIMVNLEVSGSKIKVCFLDFHIEQSRNFVANIYDFCDNFMYVSSVNTLYYNGKQNSRVRGGVRRSHSLFLKNPHKVIIDVDILISYMSKF